MERADRLKAIRELYGEAANLYDDMKAHGGMVLDHHVKLIAIAGKLCRLDAPQPMKQRFYTSHWRTCGVILMASFTTHYPEHWVR